MSLGSGVEPWNMPPEPWPIYFGREMRGGLRGGHCHVAYVSRPVLKGPGAWMDCPACLLWKKELEDSPYEE